jgi:hypothetical protein
MTPSAALVFVVSILDALLLLGSFFIYRRIVRLQIQYEEMRSGRVKEPPQGSPAPRP